MAVSLKNIRCVPSMENLKALFVKFSIKGRKEGGGKQRFAFLQILEINPNDFFS